MQMREDDQLLQNWQGKQLGNYRLIRLVGRGGFAQVYQGEHVHLQTQAAIKVLQARLSRQDQESFLTEAQMIARLQHPNIIQVLEFGIEESIPYLVMDYAPGGTLRQRYHSGVMLTPLRILPYLKQLASALQFAHEQRIVHRDIKPENMLLGSNDELLLADFGIALGVQSSRSHSIQDVAGTVTYMAPELLRGRAVPASDLYALAVVMYEWLSGAPPFRGTFVEVASQHLFRPPTPLRQAAVSREVEQVVLTALNKDPEQRFASIQGFATAFEQATLMSAVEETIKGKPRQLALQQIVPQHTEPEQTSEERQTGSSTSIDSNIAARPLASTPVLLQQGISTSMPTTPAAIIASIASSLPDKEVITSAPAISLPVKRPRGRLLMLISVMVLSVLLCGEWAGSSSVLLYLVATSPPRQLGNWQVTTISDKQAQTLYNQVTSKPPTYTSTMAANDAYKWFADRDSDGSCTFAGGAYHIEATASKAPEDCAPDSATFSDLAFQAQITIVRGDSGGLAFRASPKGKGLYYFGVDREGVYSLIVGPEPIYLLLLRSSTAITTGLNSPNLLTVIAQGTSIILYINRHYVGSVTDATSSGGYLSVFAWNLTPYAAHTGTTEVVCHGVQIWKLT
jgi:serine/threonine protein kinase